MRVETEGGGWVDHCPPPLTKKQLRKRVKELEEQLSRQRTLTFTQRAADGAQQRTAYVLRDGETQSVVLHRMYLAVPSGQPVYDVIAVEVHLT